MNEPLIELEEVRKQLGFKSIDTVRRACARGDLRAYKLGRTYKTTQVWVNEYLAKKYVGERTEV